MSQVFLYIDKPLENTPAIYQTLSPHKDEVHVEIQRTRLVGVRGPTKNFTEIQRAGKLGFGAPTKELAEIPRTRQVGVRGLNKENFAEIPRTKQVVGNLDNLFKIRCVFNYDKLL